MSAAFYCNHKLYHLSFDPRLVPRWTEVNTARHFNNGQHGPWYVGFSVQLTTAVEETRWEAEAAAEKGDRTQQPTGPSCFIIMTSVFMHC